MTDAELKAAVMADPEVAELTAYLERELPADLAALVTKDYACAIRRATVAALSAD